MIEEQQVWPIKEKIFSSEELEITEDGITLYRKNKSKIGPVKWNDITDMRIESSGRSGKTYHFIVDVINPFEYLPNTRKFKFLNGLKILFGINYRNPTTVLIVDISHISMNPKTLLERSQAEWNKYPKSEIGVEKSKASQKKWLKINAILWVAVLGLWISFICLGGFRNQLYRENLKVDKTYLVSQLPSSSNHFQFAFSVNYAASKEGYAHAYFAQETQSTISQADISRLIDVIGSSASNGTYIDTQKLKVEDKVSKVDIQTSKFWEKNNYIEFKLKENGWVKLSDFKKESGMNKMKAQLTDSKGDYFAVEVNPV